MDRERQGDRPPAPEREGAEEADVPLEEGIGLLEMHPNGYGFLRSPENNYSRERSDPFVPGTTVEIDFRRVRQSYVGPALPAPWTHRGYDLERIVGHMYMTLEGVFGVPIDVCSTIIAGFCIFGAFLTVSGAGKFYVRV